MKTKITYIISNIDKALAFEWIAEGLDHKEYELSFILLNPKKPYLYDWLKQKNIRVYHVPYFGKKSILKAIVSTYRLLTKLNTNIVHTHLFDANLVGLLAAKFKGIKKRIYTRHHSSYHHTYFPNAVKWDRFSNRLATDIIAISENVKDVLIQKEGVEEGKIHLIHHGFKLDAFREVEKSKVNDLRKKYNLKEDDYPVVGLISRYLKLKGIQHLIPAFKKLLINYPNAKLVLANASGADATYIREQLTENLEESNYIEIAFEPELFSLYQLFDVFVHVPIDSTIEAFGQTYVESLAAGIPSIFTLSGVAKEFVVDKQNALVVDFCNSEQIYSALEELLENKDLRNDLVKQGQQDVQQFEVKRYLSQLEQLYSPNPSQK